MKKYFTLWTSAFLVLAGTFLCSIAKAQEGSSWMLSANIYEVNTRIYSDSGNFNGVTARLDRLREMNTDVLCFLPVQPIGNKNRKGILGDFYAISDYQGINPEFGKAGDFKNTVDAAHERGMKVIIDWSAAFTSADHIWVQKNPTWYKKDAKGGFISPADRNDLLELDYSSKEMRKAMIAAMLYWVRDLDVDGFRCINTSLVPQNFWQEARVEISKTKRVLFVSDAESAALINSPFEMVYSRSFYNMILSLGTAINKAETVRNFMASQDTILPPFANRINYVTSYELNSFKGPEQDILGMNFMNYLVMAATLNGVPMIYTGQEVIGNRQYVAFEKSSVDWSNPLYFDKIRRLMELRHQEMALWSAILNNRPKFLETGNNEVLAYIREHSGLSVLVILNFSAQPQEVLIDLNAGGRKITEDGYMQFKTGKVTRIDPFSSIVVRLDAK